MLNEFGFILSLPGIRGSLALASTNQLVFYKEIMPAIHLRAKARRFLADAY